MPPIHSWGNPSSNFFSILAFGGEGKNPYNLEQNCLTQICSGGWVNTTGTNLTGIMETMKYAYHSVLTEDLESLKEMISRANFTYTMSSTHEVI